MTHVSVEVLDQIRKERDIAIQQLEELGTCFGEKTAIARRRIAKQAMDDLVSCSLKDADIDVVNSLGEVLQKAKESAIHRYSEFPQE